MVLEEKELPFLNQLIESLEQSEKKLEEAFNKKNQKEVEKTKKLILELNKKIDEYLKN